MLPCQSDHVAALTKLRKVNVLIELKVYYFIYFFLTLVPKDSTHFSWCTHFASQKSLTFFFGGGGVGCFDGWYLISRA